MFMAAKAFWIPVAGTHAQYWIIVLGNELRAIEGYCQKQLSLIQLRFFL